MSSVNGVSSSSTRLSGLVSGMDTDAVIKQMMAAERAKVDKLQAKVQIDDWKIDAYREVTSALQSFYNTYFDSTSALNLKSENSFASFATSYKNTDSSNYVTLTGVSGAQAGKYSITELKMATSAVLTGSNASKDIEGAAINLTDLAGMSGADNSIFITVNGNANFISLPTDGSITSVSDLKTVLQQKINDTFGADKINVELNSTSDGIKFSAVRPTDTFSINTESPALSVLGLDSSSLSNKIDLDSNLTDMADSFNTALTTGSGNAIAFAINGVNFSFDASNTSIQDIMDEVNANTKANVTMKYDITKNSFTIKSNSTGATDKVTVSDTTGSLMATLGISGSDDGSDASVTLSDGTKIVRSTNSFTYDGITYNIKQDYTAGTDAVTGEVKEPIEATITADITKTYDYIKGFVDKYNELIEKFNSKLNEDKYRNYTPLTDDQKAEMTDEQIEKWEEKAKSGLLKNDSILSGILSDLRNTLYDTVEGAGISLSSIGITTSSDYTKNGKLEINEDKLKDALANKSEQIKRLFTKSSDITYYSLLDSPSGKDQRYKESGIAQRFSDIIQDAIRTSTDKDGRKGTLLEKAGITGDRSEYTNLLFKEMLGFEEAIDEMNERLDSKEDALYAKFTAMESALSKLNEQQSNLASLLGTGT
ncbi:flagellar hook-associated protein 2 [Ruminiclostridium sufflavum DSM 19573]|uniref:Flagellar hook-associated protein 2 n=1 Tax=Ruminiclostridium sufflavum DSM 19573 TaxID=1121337 RepID=A0A318XMP2_9FIRM|nr:flagellar filament capping protein FliD [Ruminiclostridium sufflavum]PYG89127.1 flagellar hook-associated protein 2 [Ruminiclostridium sufflavum DSM 19573]